MDEIETNTKILNTDEYEIFRSKKEKDIVKEIIINNIFIVEYLKKKQTKLNSNVALAAMITSKARIKLYKGFVSVQENGGNLLYSDTDSIFASFNYNVDNEKFGDVFFDIKLKDTRIKKAIFACSKAYAIILENNEEIVKIKGVKRNSISFDEFKKKFDNCEHIIFKTENLMKSNYVIKPTNILKIFNLNYTKRLFIKNKKETMPIYINEFKK